LYENHTICNIRIYRFNIYDIYRGRSRGTYHISWNDRSFYYIMILFKQVYWLSCCHLTFRKIWYCLIKTRIDLASLSLFILM
jgi:hypothetical protein